MSHMPVKLVTIKIIVMQITLIDFNLQCSINVTINLKNDTMLLVKEY